MERAVRAWATFNAQAKSAVEAVDAERIRYLRKLLVDAGVPPQAAETRARIMNWAYLGFALSSTRLDDAALRGLRQRPLATRSPEDPRPRPRPTGCEGFRERGDGQPSLEALPRLPSNLTISRITGSVPLEFAQAVRGNWARRTF